METKPTTKNTESTGIFQGATPKLTFLFGLITGVAGAAIVGLLLFVITGFHFTKNTKAADANTNEPTYTNVAKVSGSDYVRGDKDATLTLVEFSDLECPYCKNFHAVMKQVMTDYAGKVRWVYRHFPLSFHANAQKEAEAALCVGDLGGTDKYWSFVDKIFERTKSNGTGFALTDLPALAVEVGVNKTKFESCLNNGDMASRVSSETADGTKGGATGTPTTFIVDKSGDTITAIPGADTIDQVKQILDQALGS